MIRFMNKLLTPTEPETLAEQRAQDAQYYRGILHGLINMGYAMAEDVHQQAKAQVAAATADSPVTLVPSPNTQLAFNQMARTIRRCILLAQKVCEPARARAVDDSEQRRVAARRQIIRRVEDAIHRDAPAGEAESLRAEFAERLDAPEFEADLDRPIEEVVQEIRADMGLLGANGAKRWPRRTPQDLAAMAARARAKSGPARPAGRDDPGWRMGRPDEGPPGFRGGP
jgi:hypothetical protein